MKAYNKFPITLVAVGLAGVMLGATHIAMAQDFDELQTANSPLVLEAKGSFFVGGESVEQTATQVGGFGLFGGGHITINQMYVEYMKPKGHAKKVPVVMLHGGTLSGKSYQTTPDGRMGWDEYFVRRGHAVYLPDQVTRARSGFNQAIYNDVRAGVETDPSSQPLMTRLSDEDSWQIFRFGPTFGVAHPDEQFPVEAADEFSKQGIPDIGSGVTSQAMSALAIKLDGAVLMGHSETGGVPFQAALISTTGVKGLISLEPGFCNATPAQKDTLATVPILVVFGDHLDTPQPSPFVNWELTFAACQAFVDDINQNHGGNATMLHLPAAGLNGNSHMFMLDKNNLEVADLILKWIEENIGKN